MTPDDDQLPDGPESAGPAELVPDGAGGPGGPGVPGASDGGQDPFAALGGGLDLGAMIQMASEVQGQVAEAQEVLAASRCEGTSGGGLVTVVLSGHLHLVEVRIDPAAVDPEDPSMLEDLIRAAWQSAHDQVAQLQAQTDPLGGQGGLGGLGGLLGG